MGIAEDGHAIMLLNNQLRARAHSTNKGRKSVSIIMIFITPSQVLNTILSLRALPSLLRLYYNYLPLPPPKSR